MKLSALLPFAAALVVGMAVALQPGINGQLSARLESPLRAGIISFGIGFTTLCLISLAAGHGFPRPSQLGGAPVWLWIGGGTLGALFVTTAMIVAPRIGATYWVALIVAGQMLASVILDHYGLLGFAQQTASLPRMLGVGLIVGGVFLVAQK